MTLNRKTCFERWYLFKLNNLGAVLSTALQFYSSVAKVLKLKARKCLGLIAAFGEVIGENVVREPYCNYGLFFDFPR